MVNVSGGGVQMNRQRQGPNVHPSGALVASTL